MSNDNDRFPPAPSAPVAEPQGDGDEADEIADAWLGKSDPVMGGMIGRVFGAAREAYAAGRKAGEAEMRERCERIARERARPSAHLDELTKAMLVGQAEWIAETLTPTAPHHNRVGLLASVHPRLWYWQHLQDDRSCWCSVRAPDQTCDVGEALWRLARAPENRQPAPCPRCVVVHGRSTA